MTRGEAERGAEISASVNRSRPDADDEGDRETRLDGVPKRTPSGIRTRVPAVEVRKQTVREQGLRSSIGEWDQLGPAGTPAE